MTNQGISSVNSKVQGITDKLRLTIPKVFRLFLGTLHQFIKFIPDLDSICFPFSTISKKDAITVWSKENEKAFTKINQEVEKVAETTNLKKTLRILRQPSKQGLGVVSQQYDENR